MYSKHVTEFAHLLDACFGNRGGEMGIAIE